MNDKLIAIQHELKAPKGQHNTFGNYTYRSCEDILEAVKPLLKEHGLTLALTDEVVNIGNYNYVKASAILTDDKMEFKTNAYAREAEVKKGMDDAQITGAASSYARKYALNGLFAIDDTKDPDTQDNTNNVSSKPKLKSTTPDELLNEPPKKLQGMATEKQRILIQSKLDQIGVSQESSAGYLIETYGVEVPLTKEGAAFVIDELLGGNHG